MEQFPAIEAQINKFEESKLYQQHYDNFLGELSENFQPAPVLTQALNICDCELRALVRYSRRVGVPVMSTQAGYKLATNLEELVQNLSHLKFRANSMMHTYNTCIQTFQQVQKLRGESI